MQKEGGAHINQHAHAGVQLSALQGGTEGRQQLEHGECQNVDLEEQSEGRVVIETRCLLSCSRQRLPGILSPGRPASP